MGSYFGQFKNFSPLLDKAPNYPIVQLPNIVGRARNFLKSRTAEQIEEIAKIIDFAIYCFFDEQRENEIARLRELMDEPSRWKNELTADYEYASQFFEWDGGTNQNGRWLFKEAMEDHLDIVSPINTNEIDALKELSDYWTELGENFSNFESCELFATLALWKVADTIKYLELDDDSPILQLDDALNGLREATISMGYNAPPFFDFRITIATKYALEAMDAVCYAEQLKALSNLKNDFDNKAKIEADEFNKQKSLRAKELNAHRHKKTYEAMHKVIEKWSNSISDWPSAEKAGLHFSNWLTTQGYDYEPRTVTGWIRKHAKEIGVRFR